MYKRAQGNFMIGLMITIIMGMIALSVVFGTISDQSTVTPQAGDQFTAANGTCVSLTSNCYLDNTLVVINATDGRIATGNFSECDSDSNGKADGALLNAEGADANLQTTVLNSSYSEIQCNYIQGSTTRMIVGYTPLILAVVILAFVGSYVIIAK